MSAAAAADLHGDAEDPGLSQRASVDQEASDKASSTGLDVAYDGVVDADVVDDDQESVVLSHGVETITSRFSFSAYREPRVRVCGNHSCDFIERASVAVVPAPVAFDEPRPAKWMRWTVVPALVLRLYYYLRRRTSGRSDVRLVERFRGTQCPICGHLLYRRCPSCGFELRGAVTNRCRKCRSKFPWVRAREPESQVDVLRDWRSKSEEIAETASGVKVFLTQHSLTRIEIEAIVSGDSSDGEMKGDAAEAISWEAGIRDESLVKFKEPHNSGAWITGPGRLDVEHVIHVKVADRPGAGDASQITSAVVSALRGAESIGVREVAFPAFGTGTGGLTLRASAYAMADGLTNYRGSDPNAQVDTVLVVVYKEDMREDFAGMMRTRLEQLNEGRNEASNTY